MGVLGVAFQDELGGGTGETEAFPLAHVVVPVAHEGKAIGVEEEKGSVVEEKDCETDKERDQDDISDREDAPEEEGSLGEDLEHVLETLDVIGADLCPVRPLRLFQTRQEAVQCRQER